MSWQVVTMLFGGLVSGLLFIALLVWIAAWDRKNLKAIEGHIEASKLALEASRAAHESLGGAVANAMLGQQPGGQSDA